MRVLVIEDQHEMASFIRDGLEKEGFSVEICEDGTAGLAQAQSGGYDAIVLDILLPGIDGLSILRTLQASQCSVPVILVTARDGIEDRVEGLNLGADDYLTKPFYIEELIARLRAVSRRAAGHAGNIRQIGDLMMNLVTREVRFEERPIDLSPREFNLLEFISRTPGHVYSRAHILEHVWSYHFDPHSNIVDVHIQKLRGKLNEKDREAIIETVRGVGYRIRTAQK